VFHIGLNREDLRLESYNSKWKSVFSDEANFVFDSLRDESLRADPKAALYLSASLLLTLLSETLQLEYLKDYLECFS
jgi:hypothetical protein